MYYLETSAKEAENVERLFIQIAAELMEVIDINIFYNNFANSIRYNMELYLQQARCKELPRYDMGTETIDKNAATIRTRPCCNN